jgi:hypothetical protein
MKLPKYPAGTQFNVVDVPPKFNDAEIFSSALTTGGAFAGPAGDIGGTIGMAAGGPAGQMIGSQIGKTVGLVGGGIYGAFKASQLKQDQNKLKAQAEAYNKNVPIWNQQSLLQDPAQNKYFVDNPFQMEDGSQLAPEGLAELEKDELVFRTVNGKPTLVADFVHGKLHKHGGEKFVTQQGDIIIPGNKRKVVKDLLDKNNNITDKERFQAIVSKLPVLPTNVEEVMDGNEPKYKKGSKGVKLPKYQAGGIVTDPPNRNPMYAPLSPAITGINPNYSSPEVLSMYRDQAEEARLRALRGNNPYLVYGQPSVEPSAVSQPAGMIEPNTASQAMFASQAQPKQVGSVTFGGGVPPQNPNNIFAPVGADGIPQFAQEEIGIMAEPITKQLVLPKMVPTETLDEMPNVPMGVNKVAPLMGEAGSASSASPSAMSLLGAMSPDGGGLVDAAQAASQQPSASEGKGKTMPSAGNIMDIFTDVAAFGSSIKDLFDKPEYRTPGQVRLERLNYDDISDPARRQAIAARDATQQQVRNLSGGNAAVTMANLAKANADLGRQGADIENFEARRQMEIERANQAIGTQETMTNFQTAEATRTMNEQNRAQAEDIRRKAGRDIGQTLQDLRTRKEGKTRDQALMTENQRANKAKEDLNRMQIEEMKRFQDLQLMYGTYGNTQANANLDIRDGKIKNWATGEWEPIDYKKSAIKLPKK